MNFESLKIIVDDRERKSGIPELLQSIGLNIEMKTLPVGDYIVAPETVVERKNIRDLLASIFDGRLYEQCSRLKENFENPIVLMEGNVDEIDEITENPLIFYGAISSVLIDFKIPIIPTPNAEHSAKLLVSMCSRKDNQKGPFLKKIKNKNFDLLIATPVIEVGVDIPNATCIIIESSDRFGMAQLHQIRDRVGRSNKKSFCYLFTRNLSEESVERLDLFKKTKDGFDLAEADLKLRGPGDYIGSRQSGISDISYKMISDETTLKISRKWAKNMNIKKVYDGIIKKEKLVKTLCNEFKIKTREIC